MNDRRNERGLTLVEVLIALAMLSILVGVGGLVLTRSQRLVSNTAERMSTAAEADTGRFELAKRLATTHVMKTGLAACDPATISAVRAKEPTVTLVDGATRFTFAYSQYSTMVGISQASTTQFFALDADKFPVGGVVVLTHINDSGFGGVYRVTASDPATNSITLADTFAATPKPLSCRKGDAAVSLFDLEADRSRLIFGQPPQTFRADLIRFASYYLIGRPAEPGLFNLKVDDWPGVRGNNNVDTRTVAERVVDFNVGLDWIDDGSSVLGGRAGGTFVADYAFDLQEITAAGTTTFKAGETVRTVAGRRARAVSGSVSYHLGGGLQVNFGAPVIPISVAPQYPTCALSGTPVKSIFRMPATASTTPTQVVNLVRVNAIVTSLGGTTGTFQLAGSGTTPPSCWSSAAIDPATLNGQSYPQLPGVGAQTLAINASVNTTGGVSYEPVYCDMPTGSSLTASLTYIDTLSVPPTNKPVTINCSGVVSNTGGPYVYSAAPGQSRCTTGGTIQLGSLVDAAQGTPGPTLYTDETSCDWSDGTVAGSCTNRDANGFFIPGRTLSKVRLRPTGISINDPACSGNAPAGCSEVACN